MNEDISSRDDVRSPVRSDVGEADKLDDAVQRSLSNKWNAAPSQIVEGIPKIIFREIVKRLTQANGLTSQTPWALKLQSSYL